MITARTLGQSTGQCGHGGLAGYGRLYAMTER